MAWVGMMLLSCRISDTERTFALSFPQKLPDVLSMLLVCLNFYRHRFKTNLLLFVRVGENPYGLC